MASSNGYKKIVHYYLQKDCLSIHVQSCCYQGHYVIIQGSWETEVKPNRKSNPRGWVTARSHQVTFFCAEDAHQPENRKALEYALQRSGDRLRYDKVNMSFNLANGQGGLVFTPDGAFVLYPQQTTDHSEFLFSFTEGGEAAHVG
ncbi:hypothetical protein PAAL109150_06740 [Paenibacillus alkaliterrae]|uniref:hypothetical protein n=1 Tax=Paenibacillus alkaliterrae TaxID=320909 RepID=UPI0039EF185B